MVSLVCGLFFSSCEKDFDTSNGSKLTKVIDEDGDVIYSVEYDSGGKATELCFDGDVWIKNDNDFYSPDWEASAFLNDKGYLSSIIENESEWEYTLEYDNDNHIIGIVYNHSGWGAKYSFIWDNH